ncbi:glycine cleavage system T protein, variant [Microbotryum lychnidis-dioicae p1A1 Lamole]|uniref:Aminomethyltransferase n=1 Tax=Microbotryum lychnidis-dioicae (strain p1A1 Lamole / MvSl-1064) TaxID=683840 RepID=U5HIK4_USTV1|nr:glycine cleavage system T protein [Microbotryum lychnidis-dioicae p1A1 Lamole]KDE02593.1 glycine cleavage system T protein, variant [Microbotryum lychnidis-dioicae p1A1 Lamole]|eukprot:KDE02592.1 glycine cleavage system T protein [Microbotryum lychnidis-dioicae p1A1 Lamole]
MASLISVTFARLKAISAASTNVFAYRSLSTTSSSLHSRTPLYDFHVRHQGRIVEFAGWGMPLHYAGQATETIAGGPVAEHHQVRKSAGLFDVGHMVQSTYTGSGALAFLSHLLPASLASLPIPKADNGVMRSTLSVLLNPEGGIIDDCMVTRWGENSFYLVTNAGRADRDMTWIESNLKTWNENHADKVEMNILRDAGLIALQGPKAFEALQRLVPKDYSLQSALQFASSAFIPIPSLSNEALHVTRAGYTGEDGFEIAVPKTSQVDSFAEMLLEQPEVKLAGLACRDSLRLEAGLCLYGHDLDESVGVGEAGLGWVVGRDRREPGSFIGSERTLAELKKGGTKRKRVGLVVEKGPPAREGAKIFTPDGNTEIGVVTSGLPAPTVGQNISMGFIQTESGLNTKGAQVLVQVRNRMRKAEVTSMPWITPGYYRG